MTQERYVQAHLLLYSPVPNRPGLGSLGVGDPCSRTRAPGEGQGRGQMFSLWQELGQKPIQARPRSQSGRLLSTQLGN